MCWNMNAFSYINNKYQWIFLHKRTLNLCCINHECSVIDFRASVYLHVMHMPKSSWFLGTETNSIHTIYIYIYMCADSKSLPKKAKARVSWMNLISTGCVNICENNKSLLFSVQASNWLHILGLAESWDVIQLFTSEHSEIE